MNNVYTFLKTVGLLFTVDLIWFTTGGTYARKMTELIQGKPIQIRYVSAVIVYIFLAYMLLQTKSTTDAFLYGVCIYGIYDFTCHAVFTQYDWKFAIADTLWGGVLFVSARYLLHLWM